MDFSYKELIIVKNAMEYWNPSLTCLPIVTDVNHKDLESRVYAKICLMIRDVVKS